MKKKICFISADPNFLGGVSLYTQNLIKVLKDQKKEINIIWAYKGKESRSFFERGVNYQEFKVPKIPFLDEVLFNKKIKKFLDKNFFDIINSHAIWGYWMKTYKRRRNQKIIHTYHGTTYYFYKNHLKRFDFIKKILIRFSLLYGFLIEKPPIKKAGKIICVSEHVKKELESLYNFKNNLFVIRTGVDLKKFKERKKKEVYKKLNIPENLTYGLYVGRGGFWTKGLDKIINLSKEIYKLNKNFRLIIIGAEENKIKHLLDHRFTILLPPQSREDILYYYGASDIFFSMSRCEGGAPTMVTSEAMASGCLIVTDKEANQEIIIDKENGLIVKENYKEEAKRINKILKDKEQKKKIIKKSRETIKEFSLEKWGKQYLGVLFYENNK